MATLGVVVAVLAGCASAAPAVSTPTPETGLAACESGVAHANLNVHDVTALDFAIHDCASLAQLERVLAEHPGYLDLSLTTPRQFASNRCQDPAFLDVANATVCQELELP